MDKLPFDPYDFFGYLASGLLLVIGMNFVLGFPKVLGQDLKLVDSCTLILGVYVAGQILATPSKALLEDFVVGRLLRKPSENLMYGRIGPWRHLLFPGFYKQLPPAARQNILEKAGKLSGEDLFHHVRFSSEVCANDKLVAKIDGFRNKYGFARNLCFTSLLVGLALIIKALLHPNPLFMEYGTTSLVASLFLFYRYLKFFRQYSYEMLSVYAGKG
jgi:hypothetical protein